MECVFRRGNSPNYSIRLQTPGGKAFEKSLGVSDRRQAEAVALTRYADKIAEHKTALAARRPRIEAAWRQRYEPGLHEVNGERIAATERELSYYDAAGKLLRVEPNTILHANIFGPPSLAFDAKWLPERARFVRDLERGSIAGQSQDGDDAILTAFLDFKNVQGYPRREAIDTWTTFRKLTGNKPLRKCGWSDGRLLVAHYEGQDLKSASVPKRLTRLSSASIHKRLTRLSAAVNHAKQTGALPPDAANPFARVIGASNDALRREPFNDADVATIKAHLGELGEPDRLLLRFLATTGCRLGEVFQVDGEHIEGDCRFVIVGSKTDQSLRRVPLPADLLPHLPAKIKGPLFADTSRRAVNSASKRLAAFLDKIGIKSKSKVAAHSWRHRAADRLRAAGCPEAIQDAILGHNKQTISRSYGAGFPVKVLREWIDKISF